MDSFDSTILRAVLQVAIENSDQIVANRNPIAVIRGVEIAGSDFDTIVAEPAVEGNRYLDDGEGANLGDVTVPVYPGYHFEFRGDETQEEVDIRLGRDMVIARLDREPVPFVRLRYRNPRTGAEIKGNKRRLLSEGLLTAEIQNLAGVPEGFVEFENWQGRSVSVAWRNEYIVTSDTGTEGMSLDKLVHYVDRLLRAPAS